MCLCVCLCCLGGAEDEESILKIKGMSTKINRCVWGPCNSTIISGGEDGVLRLWDTEVHHPTPWCALCWPCPRTLSYTTLGRNLPQVGSDPPKCTTLLQAPPGPALCWPRTVRYT